MILPDAEATFEVLLQKLKPLITDNTALVGIHSGGVWLVDRLLPLLGRPVARGTLDISFYRDDFDQRGLRAENKPSQIPFDVQDQHIILIDDVFHTGRTIRAAMNELFDYGRPASISLAVLVDRGGRELPIVPQIVAADIPLPVSQNLQLLQSEDGRFHFELKDSI
ncbi:bifunctional pyr operon transcriptional regulator/uracil phosphoribosyltransferase PyrR [Methylovorus menthalis]|uniref:bifunctional pyr operon transcriptional regulator/uracil phosphoribosyltransferase PyrR n=1 Tax=Methylovorus menthalis TaxID=1002227 RepID=UPI001E332F4E|nr:bifunctional pyr operon transcriptional regulator/uracil phosphoribosyltransferase PyrR [Methylovorus menthalis]MCB4810524.1 bifunctional pyr operon transcriptional regulator/uracil phosphoribosyltransferase PyrR [Methylovorus menthalis]